MPSDPMNVKLGVCRVTFDGTDLGYTSGGVEVDISTQTKEVNVDQFGNSPIDEIVLGRTVKVKVPLAETTLDNLAAITPGAALVVDSTDPTLKRLDVPHAAGLSLLSLAKKLVLHPQALPDDDHSDDFTIPLAMTPGTFTFAYKTDTERVYNVEFTGYPDATTKKLFMIGDESAVAA